MHGSGGIMGGIMVAEVSWYQRYHGSRGIMVSW